jgi:hypothetical protein
MYYLSRMKKQTVGRPEVPDKKISKTVSILSSKYRAIIKHYGSISKYLEIKMRYDKTLNK